MAISNNSTGLRPGVCTSSTRPTAPYEGQMIYETDTDMVAVWNGTAWRYISATTPTNGTVLQVVTATTTTQVTSSSGTAADTGLTATITPKSASSKILVLVSQAGCSKSSASGYNALSLILLRGATKIMDSASFVGYNGNAGGEYLNMGTIATNYLDSPATTSATTYKTQFFQPNGNFADIKVQDNIGSTVSTSSITLMEISA